MDLVVAANYQGWIRPIQVFILAFVFLFFFRVIRAIMVESRPPIRDKRQERSTASAAAKKTWLYLTVLEPLQVSGSRSVAP